MATKGHRLAQRWFDRQKAEQQAKKEKVLADYIAALKPSKPERKKKPAPTMVSFGPQTGGGSLIPSGWFTPTSGTVNANSISNGGNYTINWGASGIFTTGESLPPEPKVAPKPFDDPARFIVERKIAKGILECLEENHYPVGIALSEVARDALKDSPLLTRDGWDEGFHFMNIKLILVDVDDPLFVEVGW